MLRSDYLDTSTESLLRAAEYLNLPDIVAEPEADASSTFHTLSDRPY